MVSSLLLSKIAQMVTSEELMHFFPWMETGNVCMIPKVLLLIVARLIHADRLA